MNKKFIVHFVGKLSWNMQPNIFEQDCARDAANSSRNITTDQQEQHLLQSVHHYNNIDCSVQYFIGVHVDLSNLCHHLFR